MGQLWLDGYSAHVEIYLLVNGERFDVAQICDGSLILRRPRRIGPTQAVLVIKVDGHEERESIYVAEGGEVCEEAVRFF